MRRHAIHPAGAFHPVIFFALVYAITLVLAIFVCRTVYYSINGDEDRVSRTIDNLTNASAQGSTASLR